MSGENYSNIFGYAKTRYAIILILSTIIIGVIGYMSIEGAGFIDSLFMTVITVSTVGYGMIFPLSEAGKIFSIFLIVLGYITFAYGISVITSYFVEGEIGNFFSKYRMKSKLNKMRNHVIVVGYGRNGREACQQFISIGQPVLVIENDHNIIMSNVHKDIHFIEGDATEDSILEDAHIKTAKALLATLPMDADNLYIVMSARALNPNLKIVSRAKDEAVMRKLKTAGTDYAVMPESVGGQRMAQLINQPDVVSFMEKISLGGMADTNLVEIICSNLPDELLNHSISDLNIRNRSGANIIGFKNPDGSFIINPSPETKMTPNTKLFVLGTKEQITKMKEILNL